MKLRVLVVLLVVVFAPVWASGARPAEAADGGPPAVLRKLMAALAEGEPAFTDQDLAPLIEKITPLVERLAGRRFKKPPKIKLAGRKAVTQSLIKDIMPQMMRLMKSGGNKNAVRAQVSMQASVMAMCLLGKYGLHDKTLYMMPKNFPPLLKLTKTDVKQTMAIVQITLAHELTHCLQDQEIDLAKKIGRMDDIEAAQAFNAVMEGQAVFVGDLVGRELKLDDAMLANARMLGAGAVKLDDPALEMISKQMATQFEQIYIGGRGFVAYHHKRGGMARVWQILDQPPVETSMITKPATYSATRKADINYEKILAGLEKYCMKRRWHVMNMRVGEMMLRSVYANVEPKTRKEILANVSRVQTFSARWPQTPPQAMLNVSLIVLKDPAFATRMVDALVKAVQKNIERLKASPMVKVTDFRVERFAGAPADATVASKLIFTIKVGPQTIVNTFVRVGRGNTLIEIHHMNAGLDDKKVAAIAEQVLTRYEMARKGAPAAKLRKAG